MKTDNTRIAVYDRIRAANDAVRRLIARGIDRDRIQVVSSEELPQVSSLIETADGADDRALSPLLLGATVGLALGAGGAAIGLAIAGTGAAVAGPILGGAVAMAVTGGLLSAMAARGAAPEVVDYYDQALADGQVLVAVEPSADSSQPDQSTVQTVLEPGARQVAEMSAS